jgi:large repetitive protein
VASAGDVNGDGLGDLIVGARESDGAIGIAAVGRSYVVFGKTGTTAVDLSGIAAGSGGFVINGQCRSESSGHTVAGAGAGDANGDGFADVIVGTITSDSLRSYVVFGKTGSAAIDLSAIANGSGGFIIDGNPAVLFSPERVVAGAADVNGDGLADLIIGSRRTDTAVGYGVGRSFVVFGKTGTTAVDLSDVKRGSGGFVINGQCEYDYSGISVAGAADVNGDGLADLIVLGREHHTRSRRRRQPRRQHTEQRFAHRSDRTHRSHRQR